MKTICDLPEEVLLMVFEQLNNGDLSKCQRVCRSWYFPAHKIFLKTVNLQDVDQVVKFIESIDHNPDPRYLASVKHIIIYEEYELLPVQFRLSKDDIKKLFFRFSNLETVEEKGEGDFMMYSEFNEDLCKELLISCPKLHTFNVLNRFADCKQLFKLCSILTKIMLTVNFASYVPSFCRLKSLVVNSADLNTFEKHLPLFEQLPDLTKLEGWNVTSDQDEFADRYLANRNKDEQDVLIERLSKVTDLEWHYKYEVCVNDLKFITKYLTGLTRLYLSTRLIDTWTLEEEYHPLCDSMLDFFHSRSSCHINAIFRIKDLSGFLGEILQKVYQQPAKTDGCKFLKLIVTKAKDYERKDLAELHIEKKTKKSVSISIKGEDTLRKFMKHNVLPETSRLDNVDYFEFQPLEGEYIDYTTYEKLLDWIQSLKHVHLHIPLSFKETEEMHYTFDQKYNGNIYPQVEQLTINTHEGVRYQTLLNRFSFAFPNIQQLNFHNHCGFCRQQLGEFELVLSNYSLKHLKIDIMPMKNIMLQYIKKPCTSDTDFFVVEIESLSTSERHSYKVVPYSLSATKLNGGDLKGFVRGKDFFRLHITVNDLEQFELYRGTSTYDDHDTTYPKCVIKLNE